jgi:bacteriorhodopsin
VAAGTAKRWRVCQPLCAALNAMEIAQIIFLTWLYYLVGAIGAFAVFIFMRVKKINYSRHEHWVLVVPFFIWFTLMLIPGQDKSLSNLIESFFIGIAVSVLAILRLLLKSKIRHASLVYFVLSCVASIAIFMSVPGLPE